MVPRWLARQCCRRIVVSHLVRFLEAYDNRRAHCSSNNRRERRRARRWLIERMTGAWPEVCPAPRCALQAAPLDHRLCSAFMEEPTEQAERKHVTFQAGPRIAALTSTLMSQALAGYTTPMIKRTTLKSGASFVSSHFACPSLTPLRKPY